MSEPNAEYERYVQDFATAEIWGPFNGADAQRFADQGENRSILVVGIESTFTKATVITSPPTHIDRSEGSVTICSEGNHVNDDNPGHAMCKTCEEWHVEQ